MQERQRKAYVTWFNNIIKWTGLKSRQTERNIIVESEETLHPILPAEDGANLFIDIQGLNKRGSDIYCRVIDL